MNPVLAQFLAESREALQGIAALLMQLEETPADGALMDNLFRLVHTLKGNSGLFEVPEMTRVLHAAEDVMDAVRKGTLPYSQALADRLLDAMDLVGALCAALGEGAEMAVAAQGADAVALAAALRALIGGAPVAQGTSAAVEEGAVAAPSLPAALARVPEPVRLDAFSRAAAGAPLHWVRYQPHVDCFFQGQDPFHAARQTPGLLWGVVTPPPSWAALAELDPYHCALGFTMLAAAPREALLTHFRYVAEQVSIAAVPALWLVQPEGDPNGGPVYDDFVAEALALLHAGDLAGLAQATRVMLQLSNPELWLSSALRWLLALLEAPAPARAELELLIGALRTLTPPDWAAAVNAPTAVPAPPPTAAGHDAAALAAILAAQHESLQAMLDGPWQPGWVEAVARTLRQCCVAQGQAEAAEAVEAAHAQALAARSVAPLWQWLCAQNAPTAAGLPAVPADSAPTAAAAPLAETAAPTPGWGRRAEDGAPGRAALRVDQARIDRLMDLIGEMVVAKNGLPYLAQRAEDQFGVRELAREVKAQYAVINRIAEEMQDAIMQIRLLPVSFVFQRFPRLVRDLARKLDKEVRLVLEGEDTAADKSIIEALADPLIHIVRNSLDHGFELPAARRAAGKPAVGTLTIRAAQEGDQVLIDISDDGRGIDPALVRRKAYEKGLIDEAALERLSDAEALNLVFAPGFSTADTISDLSGRGVGMDVVRAAVARVNGSIALDSELGRGTRLRIALPLSMAVTKVMIVESHGQLFGVPMEQVVETVRVPAPRVRRIKQCDTTLLRGQLVGLRSLNTLLALEGAQRRNADAELAVLVVRVGAHTAGVIVDAFHEAVDVIQKPLGGVLAGLGAYTGAALLGNGAVLMVLNLKELIDAN